VKRFLRADLGTLYATVHPPKTDIYTTRYNQTCLLEQHCVRNIIKERDSLGEWINKLRRLASRFSSHVTIKTFFVAFLYGMTNSFEFHFAYLMFYIKYHQLFVRETFNARQRKDLFTFSMYVLWHRSRWQKCFGERA
jgi:hypothetical protein